jgi:predicted alpha/beta-hydrolase family hydrolase
VADSGALLWAAPGGAGGGGGAGLVLGHSAGARVTDPPLGHVAAGLAARGHPVLGFNFAYSEAGRRLPDPAARLESAFRDAVALARPLLGGPLVLGGRSMGGRIASHLAAQGEPCAGLVLLCYPLHPAGRPERLRTAHWPALRVPLLFVQGDADDLCDLDLLERERRLHLGGADSRVHVLAGADHDLRVPGRPHAQVLDEVVAVVAEWLRAAALQAAAGPAR